MVVVLPGGADKGDGLRLVAAHLGVPPARVVACGDVGERITAARRRHAVAVGEMPHALGQLPEVVVTSWARLPDTLRALVLPML